VDYRNALRWFHAGTLPEPSEQMRATGTILVDPGPQTSDGAGIYAGVSSHDQKGDLDRQVARLTAHVAQDGKKVVSVASEVGPGVNGHRQQLRAMLRDPKVGR